MNAGFVVDCSVAMAWCFPDEATAATRRLLDRLESESALVPAWWFVEVTNVLALAERKGRIEQDKTAEFIALVEGFVLEVDDEGPRRSLVHLLPLCRTHYLTSYDALYLDLAVRRRMPLATLDEPLRKAAKKLGVVLLGR